MSWQWRQEADPLVEPIVPAWICLSLWQLAEQFDSAL
jgi:hypothetical protein